MFSQVKISHSMFESCTLPCSILGSLLASFLSVSGVDFMLFEEVEKLPKSAQSKSNGVHFGIKFDMTQRTQPAVQRVRGLRQRQPTFFFFEVSVTSLFGFFFFFWSKPPNKSPLKPTHKKLSANYHKICCCSY